MSELYPGSLQIPAMLISKDPKEKDLSVAFASGKYIGQQKLDGYWYMIEKTPEGNVYLFSRSKSKKTGELTEKIDNVPHIKKWAEENLPNGTILVGEIYVPGGKSKDCTRIMGCLPNKAIDRQKVEGNIHYYIHDCLEYDGKMTLDNDYISRYNTLYSSGLFDTESDSQHYLSSIPEIELAVTYYDNFPEILGSILDAGGEGMVFKSKEAPYRQGKRPKDNFKVKEETTFDVVVTGFIEPVKEYTGKEADTWSYKINGELVTKSFYHGWKAGFVISAYDGGELKEIGTISSGMTDFLREDTAENPDKYLGHVIEIKAMSVDKQRHSIRHGRFIRIREDKNKEDCTFDTIF